MWVSPHFSVGILLATCFVIGCNTKAVVLEVEIEPVESTPTEKDGAPTSGHRNLENDSEDSDEDSDWTLDNDQSHKVAAVISKSRKAQGLSRSMMQAPQGHKAPQEQNSPHGQRTLQGQKASYRQISGDDCPLTKIFTCAAEFGVKMAKCLEKLDILKCLKDILGVTNKCYKCAIGIACNTIGNACKPGNCPLTVQDDCPLTKFFTCGEEFGVKMANCIGKLKSAEGKFWEAVEVLACARDIVPLGNKCYPCAKGIACNACKLGQPLATTLQTCRVG